MPVYEYECRHCGNRFEIMRGVNDPPVKRCPKCEGVVMKVFQPFGIVFKGNGFYATDSRKKNGNGRKEEKKAEPVKSDVSTTSKKASDES